MGIAVFDDRVEILENFAQLTGFFPIFDTVENGFVVFVDQDDNLLTEALSAMPDQGMKTAAGIGEDGGQAMCLLKVGQLGMQSGM